jgi:putative endonuclease
MTHARARLGSIGEQIAARHVEQLGLEVIERNWRCADGAVRGELDLVCWEGRVLVFCEVKTRRRAVAGTPLVAITAVKAARLRRLAAAYLASSGVHPAEVRFDALAVSWPPGGGRAEVMHVRGAC